MLKPIWLYIGHTCGNVTSKGKHRGPIFKMYKCQWACTGPAGVLKTRNTKGSKADNRVGPNCMCRGY